MTLLTSLVFLLIATSSVQCTEKKGIRTSIQKDEQKIYEIIRKFEICDLKCNGKYCECCQTIPSLFNIEVCGTSLLTTNQKTVDINLKVAGQNLASTKVTLDRLVNFCRTVNSKYGDLDICVDASLNESKNNAEAFSVCGKVDVGMGGVEYLKLTYNCVEYDGDITIDGGTQKDFKTLASVKVLNGGQLAKVIQKIVLGRRN